MHRVQRIIWAASISLVLLAGVLGVISVHRTRAEGLTQSGQVTALSALGTAFSYQGQLKDGNGPVTDTCDFQFGLYDADSGGSPLGNSPQTITAVAVDNGLFRVSLDFGNAVFTGQAAWLEVAVRCPTGSGAYTTLTPRQALTPVPYALYAANARSLITSLPVAPGETITAGNAVSFLDGKVYQGNGFGTEVVWSSQLINYFAAATLSPTQFVVAGQRPSDPAIGFAMIGTVSGADITFGSLTPFPSTTSKRVSVAALSASQFVVAYIDADNSDFGTAMIGTVSGNAITFGAPFVFNPAATTEMAVAALSPTQFVIAYPAPIGTGTAVVGSVSGNTISFGTPVAFGFGNGTSFSIAALSATRFVVVYTDANTTWAGVVRVGSVSGDTITIDALGLLILFDLTQRASILALSPTQFILAYQSTALSPNVAAAITLGTISGDQVAFGTPVAFNSVAAPDVSLAKLSPTEFIIAYKGERGYGMATRGEIGAGGITFRPTTTFCAVYTCNAISMVALSSSQIAIAYRSGGPIPQIAKAIVGESLGRTLLGIAQSNASGNMTLPVVIGGTSDIHAGLTPGEIYYAQSNGVLTTTVTGSQVGLAISPSTIWIKQAEE